MMYRDDKFKATHDRFARDSEAYYLGVAAFHGGTPIDVNPYSYNLAFLKDTGFRKHEMWRDGWRKAEQIAKRAAAPPRPPRRWYRTLFDRAVKS